jgi:hypothetical protein
MKENVPRNFVADVIIYLIGKIKYYKDRKFEPSIFIKDESKETQRRHVCTFYLTGCLHYPLSSYGISRFTMYRRLKELERAGIIEVERLGKCWIPTKEFYLEMVKLLEK